MPVFRHLLVPVDFEESSARALDTAIDLAVRFEAKLTVFHAWDLPATAYTGTLYLTADLLTPIEEAARKALDACIARVRVRLPQADAVLARGMAATEILAATERLHVDLIVIGTHGRHGVSRVLLGSVAEKVVRMSPVPVLTVRGGASKA